MTISLVAIEFSEKNARYIQARCVVSAWEKKNANTNNKGLFDDLPMADYIDTEKLGCGSRRIYVKNVTEVLDPIRYPPADAKQHVGYALAGLAATAALAALAFFACWTIGWVFAGFSRD